MKPLSAFYIIPWAFLGLYGDIALHTIWLYPAALLAPIILGWYIGKRGKIALALTGNLLSAAVSFVSTLALGTDRWNAYCKPFGALGILLILWLIALLVQAIIWRHYRKDHLTAILLWLSALFLLLSPHLCQFLALI